MRTRNLVCSISLALTLNLPIGVFGATNQWTGGQCAVPVVSDCGWSTAQNWLDQKSPANNGTADIVFGAALSSAPEMDSSWNVHSITFDVAASSYGCAGGGRTLTIQAGGILHNSLTTNSLGITGSGDGIVLGASQTWAVNSGRLEIFRESPVSFNGKDLTVTGVSNIAIFPKIGGPGRLIKAGTGTLFLGGSGAFNTNFTGSIIINQGVLQIDGAQTVRKAAAFTLNGGALVLNRQNSIGSSTTAMVFNGGRLQAIAPNTIVNPSDFYGTLVISNNVSSIDLSTNDSSSSTLTFAAGSRAGNGTLTVTGWSGTAGNSGTDDKIFISSAPSADFLSAIVFDGFYPGAIRLASGEIVPDPAAQIWNGLGANDNWSTGSNWVSTAAPANDGTALVVFDGTTRPTPVTDTAWDVLGVGYGATAGAFTNSGSDLTIRSNGIVNFSASRHTILNNILMAAPQAWNAVAGPLGLRGTNDNGGSALTIDGGFGVTFGPGGGLSGSGGLVKNGTGTLTVGAPMTFSGPITLNSGTIETPVGSVCSNQDITFSGGRLSGLSSTHTLGGLTLAASSTISLDPFPSTNNPPGLGVLVFAGGTRTGGLLNINGWTGVAGNSGADDKIRFLSDPGVDFLGAIRFTGFAPGAIRLADGEIVPPASSTWNGAGLNDNWSTPQNWVAGVPPLNNGSASVIFDGNTRLTPVTDLTWDIFNLAFTNTASSFSNSGSPLTIRSAGVAILNSSPNLQTIANNVTLGAAQTWNAATGPLAFGGTNSNGGFALTINGSSAVSFSGGGLSGAGGLVKNGTGTLTLSAPMTFTGAISLNNGAIATAANNVLANQNLTLNGGALSGLSKSQTLGALALATNSTLNLDPGNTAGVLTFSSATVSGGTLTVNGWTGVAGQSGADDKIIVNANPGAAFLNALRFTGFPPGATYLSGTGEIVPPGAVRPALAAAMRTSGTQFQFTIAGSAGQSYTVQLSTDFTNWTSILTTNAPGNLFTFVDPNATNNLGFYRVLVNP